MLLFSDLVLNLVSVCLGVSQSAAVWERSTAENRNNASYVHQEPIRTGRASCPASPAPAPRDRASQGPRTSLSAEVCVDTRYQTLNQ